MLAQLKYKDVSLPSNMGTNWTLTDYSNYLNTEEGQRQLQLCNIYGMDPHLLFALEKVESNLDHYNHIGTYDANGKYLFAVGITQQERANFYSVNASAEEIASKPPRTGYNYETNQIDSIPLCEDQLNDFDTNVKLGIMALNGALGLSDYDISSTLATSISQRLIRKLCPHCRRERDMTEEEKQIIQKIGNKYNVEFNLENAKTYDAIGCEKCNNSGYFDRIAIYETLLISENIKELIVRDASTIEIREEALKEGYKPLIVEGLKRVVDGTTTLEELNSKLLFY